MSERGRTDNLAGVATPARAILSQSGVGYDDFADRRSQNHPVNRYLAALDSWRLEIVKRYAIGKGLYAPEEIDRVEREYKRFLALLVAYPEQRVPISAKVDDLWHSHILFTENYAAMGQAVCGRHIHHRPAILDGQELLNRHFKSDTLQLYRQHFGEPDPTIWDIAICCGSTN